jgi:hypothetical protein
MSTPATLDYLAAEEWNDAVLIYDTTGKLVDIPQDDIESYEVEDVINGGSSQGTFNFRRLFNDIGALGFRYLFQVFLWPQGSQRPADPYWSGHFVDFDQNELNTTGQIVAKCEGDFALLNDALVNVQIAPNEGGNPSLDAATFLTGLLKNYQPNAYFGTASIPSTMFNLEPTLFQDEHLADAIDTVCKIGRDDTSGLLYTWFVRTKGDLTRKVEIVIDQNPNVVSTVKFIHLFKDASFANYTVQTKYRDVFNVLAVYGGQDSNGQQVYGVYQDTASIAALGCAIEAKLSNSSIISAAAAQTYATLQLDLSSSPTAQGNFDLLQPNQEIRAGTWVQIWETPETQEYEATIKQVRIAMVKLGKKSARIYQTCSLQAPTPYLDDAIYRLGVNIAVNETIQNSQNPGNAQSLYIRAGGYVTNTASSPAEIQTAPVEAVFPNVGLINVAGFGLSTLVDNSGGANNGQTGDGWYVLSVTSAGMYIVTKITQSGGNPPNTNTQQNLVGIFVVDGAPYCTDLRNLVQGTPSDPTLEAPALVGGTTPTFVPPVNSGKGTYQQRIKFDLLTPQYSAPWLDHFQLQAVVCDSAGVVIDDSTGTPPPPSACVNFAAQQSNIYDVTIGLGASNYYQLQIVSVDTQGRVSAPLVLGNTANNPLLKGAFGGVPAGTTMTLSGVSWTVDPNAQVTGGHIISCDPTYTLHGCVDGSWVDYIEINMFSWDPAYPGQAIFISRFSQNAFGLTGTLPFGTTVFKNITTSQNPYGWIYDWIFVATAYAANGESVSAPPFAFTSTS